MRTGTDARTGELLTGWAHCRQSLGHVLTTVIGSIVMARDYGSAALALQDRNATPMRIMQIYAGIAAAIRAHEPGYRLRTVQLVRYGADGAFAFLLSGIFYPRGHLGDYSVSEEREAVLAANDNGFRILGATA